MTWTHKQKPLKNGTRKTDSIAINLSKRSSARSFIRNHATGSDLNELEVLIAERRCNLGTIKD